MCHDAARKARAKELKHIHNVFEVVWLLCGWEMSGRSRECDPSGWYRWLCDLNPFLAPFSLPKKSVRGLKTMRERGLSNGKMVPTSEGFPRYKRVRIGET